VATVNWPQPPRVSLPVAYAAPLAHIHTMRINAAVVAAVQLLSCVGVAAAPSQPIGGAAAVRTGSAVRSDTDPAADKATCEFEVNVDYHSGKQCVTAAYSQSRYGPLSFRVSYHCSDLTPDTDSPRCRRHRRPQRPATRLAEDSQ
jgi:hypothetical protein